MTKMKESLKTLPEKNDILHEHIADTYFYTTTKKRAPAARKKHRTAHKKTDITKFILPAAILSSIITLMLLAWTVIHPKYISYLKKKIDRADLVNIVSGGALNKGIMKRIEFHGYARDRDAARDKILHLINPRKYNWADMSIDFKFPINLSGKNISASVRGKVGGEKINLVLRDSDNRSYRLNDIFLTPGWRSETIMLDSAKNNIDLTRIRHLRLESGFVGDPPGNAAPAQTDIFIRDIKISKRR